MTCGGWFDACLGSAAAGKVSFLAGEATRTLAVIVAMLRRRPQQEPTAGSSGQPYGQFLELPVPVVLVVLWLFGAVLLGMLLGTVLTAAYSAEVWLLAAMALL